ncbi:MAG: alpha/beta fold hydrolase [Eubacteriaceae bacterium]|nr:alpha/beta fold hydrolase [Eubacteriaceae bacterium]
MPLTEVEKDISLAYEELGSGDRYILSMMQDFPPESSTRAMAEKGYHVFLITNRGFGASTHVTEDYGDRWYEVFADDVVRFADAHGIDSFVYMGCSHGAGTGWHLAIKYPERVKAIIAMSGGPHNLDEGDWSYRTMAAKGIKMPPMDPPSDDEAVRARTERNRVYLKALRDAQSPEEKAVDYKRPMMYCGTDAVLMEELGKITAPVLMLGCLEDPISRPDLMLRTARSIKNGKTVLYSRFGHSGPYSQLVEETVFEADAFIRNVEETGRYYKKVEGLD